MRFIPIVMLALLMLGFASRPTVSSALTDGRVLMHPFASASIDHSGPIVDQAMDEQDEINVTKCVSLGVLPCGWSVAGAPKTRADTQAPVLTTRVHRSYSILRPPRLEA